ncbi:MAG: cysteine hydrolase [Leptolyngbya sp.]|nr:cysteine hydrolase [Candidatus Melainabacteria bacterium]
MNNSETKRALIVVDIQNDYFPGGKWTLHNMEAAANNAALLIQSARSSGELVVHIRHEFPSVEAPFFAPGSKGAEINETVKNHDGEEVVVKHQINSYRDTNLKEILDRHNIEEVVICGAMSHMCVDAVTRASNDFGYKVNVVHDACASRDLEFNGTVVPAAQVHAAFMSALGFAYATMHSTQEYLAATKPKVQTAK